MFRSVLPIAAGLARTGLLFASPARLASNCKNVALWIEALGHADSIETWRNYFDPAWYLRAYPDIARLRVDPFLHFLLCGNAERRNPSPAFDSGFYLTRYPEVAASGLNPLLHFAVFGKKEGRSVSSARPGGAPWSSVVGMPVVNDTWPAETPLVSVVIPCFNYGQYLEAALESVLNQTFQNFEIVVVEGGSTDPESVAHVRRIEASAPAKTRFYFREERHLAGDNRNFGIARARGRYVCCLDADDLMRPVYLEVAVFLAEAFGYDLVYPSLQAFGESDMRWLVEDASMPAILDHNQVSTVALFRKAAWQHVGGIRDWGLGDQYIYEDWDFWIRLVGHGCRARSISEPLMQYRVHRRGLTQESPDIEKHRRALRAANEDLAGVSTSLSHIERRVLNPLANLGADESGARPSFLLALPFITIGGAEKLFLELAEYLTGRGERLIVVTSLALAASIPDDRNRFDALTPHVYHLAHLFHDETHSREFFRYLVKHYGVDTLMLAGSELVYGMLPELRRDFPALSIVDQLFNESAHAENNRCYADYIDATIVPSPALAAALQQRRGGAQTVHVIPHGVLVPAAPRAANNGRGKVTVSFFGRLAPEKGPDIFVEIVRRLSNRSELCFVMTGDGAERARIESLITKYGLTDRIHAPGFVDDVEPLMQATDIVVLPSRIDGMPLAVLEAQARGKPVVASRVGSLPHMIADQQSGFLCEPGNIAAFCDRIMQLACDAELRQRMGQEGRRLMAENHNAARMFEKYRQVFDAVRAEKQMFARAQPVQK